MTNIKKIGTLVIAGLALSALPALAICPVCIVAVGAGLGLSRYLGIDDTVTGLWIGGLTVSMICWTIDWARPKIKNPATQPYWNILIIVAYYVMIAWPLHSQEFIGHPLNRIWGIDKLVLSITIGSLTLYGLNQLYLSIKKNNNGHAQFPFEKVVLPVGGLLILSLFFYLLTR
jgi:hypothetical protein